MSRAASLDDNSTIQEPQHTIGLNSDCGPHEEDYINENAPIFCRREKRRKLNRPENRRQQGKKVIFTFLIV
jgi:hypothetical protein